MNMHMSLIVGNLVLAGTLIAQTLVSYSVEPRGVMASWKDRPESLEATVKLADTVATGRVVKIRKANPIVTRINGEPGNVDRIPIEVVTLQLLDDDVKGKGKKGGTVEVFHTGHSDAASQADRKPPPGRPPEKPSDGVERNAAEQSGDRHMAVLFSGVMMDPAYKVGEEYVLLVRKGPSVTAEGKGVETMAIVSPEGRFRINADQSVEPMSDRAFAKELRGKNVKELRDKAKGVR